MPLVSVIINVRNGAAYLRDALDSVMAQTFADWELIAWDDCSTDNSAKIIAEYRDARVRYFLSPDDTPLGEARNRAIRQAAGEWLAFLDQDDIWLPHKLEQQMALAANEVGIIYGRTVLFDATHGNLRDYDHVHEFEPLPEGDIFTPLFADACFIAMSSAVLRRSVVAEVGEVPAAITVVPDYYLYVALARRCKARAVQKVVCRYRVHPGSMTASRSRQLRLHEEPLWIIRHWTPNLPIDVVAFRTRTYSTVLALEEMKTLSTFSRGIRRLFKDGSLIWLISRAFALTWRAVRRKIRKPYWLAIELASDPD
jgi:glycosyltransferase involved in cell wall biosynthesis